MIRRGPLAARAAAAALLLGGAPMLPAQTATTVSGRVVHPGPVDSTPVPGALVVLHRIGRDRQGPIDSVVAGAAGQFRFRFRTDTGAIYLLSSGYAGIEYFSTPLHTDPAAPDTGLLLPVFDTSSAASIRVSSRHLVIRAPQPDGSRPVLEILVLENEGFAARPAGDSLHPAWATPLPAGVLGFQAGRGDVSEEAYLRQGDRMMLLAPLAPGVKQLLYNYTLPAGATALSLPVGDSVGMFALLLEERGLAVRGRGLAPADSQVIEGRRFDQWVGAVPSGTTIEVRLSRGAARWLLPVLVAALTLVLAASGVMALRRRPPTRSGALEQLARLDTLYAGREGEVPPEEWATYQSERARLKQDFEAELARRSGRP